MQPNGTERSRTGFVQFLIILIIVFLTLIMVLIWKDGRASLVMVLSILSLGACLYLMARVRGLERGHDQLLETLAHQRGELEAATAERSELEGRHKELTSLYRAISAVNAVSNYNQAFEAVLTAAIDLVHGDTGSLMLVDKDRTHLRFASAVGIREEVLTTVKPRIGEGIAGWVAEHAKPVLLEGSAGSDPRFEDTGRNPELGMGISIPLEGSSAVIGVLNLGITVNDRGRVFTDGDLRFVYIFAQHAAIAVERAQLLGAV